jgi:hypothetical protein
MNNNIFRRLVNIKSILIDIGLLMLITNLIIWTDNQNTIINRLFNMIFILLYSVAAGYLFSISTRNKSLSIAVSGFLYLVAAGLLYVWVIIIRPLLNTGITSVANGPKWIVLLPYVMIWTIIGISNIILLLSPDIYNE